MNKAGAKLPARWVPAELPEWAPKAAVSSRKAGKAPVAAASWGNLYPSPDFTSPSCSPDLPAQASRRRIWTAEDYEVGNEFLAMSRRAAGPRGTIGPNGRTPGGLFVTPIPAKSPDFYQIDTEADGADRAAAENLVALSQGFVDSAGIFRPSPTRLPLPLYCPPAPLAFRPANDETAEATALLSAMDVTEDWSMPAAPRRPRVAARRGGFNAINSSARAAAAAASRPRSASELEAADALLSFSASSKATPTSSRRDTSDEDDEMYE